MLRMLSWGKSPVPWALLWRHLPDIHLQQVFPPSPILGSEETSQLHLQLIPATLQIISISLSFLLTYL